MSKSVNLTNQRFGKLIVLGRGEDYISPSGSHLLRWKCKCECGNEMNITTSQLKRGQQCPLCTSRREDLTGQVFGRLTVMSYAGDYISPKGSCMARWHCKCVCGNEVDVLARSLKCGDTKSCGCLNHSSRPSGKKTPPSDIIGRRYGYLTVIECAEENNSIKASKFR